MKKSNSLYNSLNSRKIIRMKIKKIKTMKKKLIQNLTTKIIYINFYMNQRKKQKMKSQIKLYQLKKSKKKKSLLYQMLI